MNTIELKEYAFNNNICIYDYNLGKKKAFSTKNIIAINDSIIDNHYDYKTILAEEIGHIMTDSFYSLSSCTSPLQKYNIAKCERIAKDYSIKLLVALDMLNMAISKYKTDADIADFLDISIPTLHSCIEYYKRKNMLKFKN